MSTASPLRTAVAPVSAFPFLKSTIGRKAIMAVTGFILVGFVVGHMVGNLQIFMGSAAPEMLKAYAEFLHSMGHGLAIWGVRFTLLAAVVLHSFAALTLTLESWKARPVRYQRWTATDSTIASRTMRWSGPALALFVVYHILHFTVGSAHDRFVEGAVYNNVVMGFQVPVVSAVYIAAMLALGLHLYHGIWSMLQTLGLSHPQYDPLRRIVSATVAGLVVVANCAMPIAVLAGFLLPV
jgi:succinate dehydrogenase / fumarate reductase cytochrome b subunit